MTSKIRLPETPSVVARDRLIVIIYDDGSEQSWGEETSQEEAVRVAKELEIELRAIRYIQWHVHNFVHDMRQYLASQGISEDLLSSILVDGHGLAKTDLDEETVKSIFENASARVRHKVLRKIAPPNFIV